MKAILLAISFFFQLINLSYQSDIITVCNSTYCDELEAVKWCPLTSNLHAYITSADGDRFKHKIFNFRKNAINSEADFSVKINSCEKYQKIVGFGGALTDASAQQIKCLSPEAKKNFMTSYFHRKEGIGINILRVPLGASDFSEAPYTYDDTDDDSPDPNLTNFRLNDLDINDKIPLIKEAQDINGGKITLKGAIWRNPSWATTQKEENLTAFLIDNTAPELLDMTLAETPIGTEVYPKWFVKQEYFGTLAKYLSRALTEYKERGVNFDWISAGNEIAIGPYSDAYEFDVYKDWITNHLSPQLKEDGHDSVKLLAFDDNTVFMKKWSQILEDPDTRSSVQGWGTHWYFDSDPEAVKPVQDDFCQKYPEQTLISTEASQCEAESDFFQTTDWQKLVRSARDIISKLSSCLQGFIDWNIALDFQGGPNWVHNYCYAAVAVNCSADEFHKRVMFYGFGHFSKFIPPGSVRVKSVVDNNKADSTLESLKVVAFEVKSKFCWMRNIVVVALNTNDQDVTADICLENEKCATVEVPKNSIISTVALNPLYATC